MYLDMMSTLKSERIWARKKEVVREALRAKKFSRTKLFEDAIAFIEEGLVIAKNRGNFVKQISRE